MLLSLFFILTVELVFGKLWVMSCSSHEDCLEGYFCDKNFCRKCLKCDLIFRKGSSCVIDFNDCEDCLDGYEEILTTDFFSAVKPCKLIKKKVNLKMCINDSSCPTSNYCDGDVCVKCFDCSLVNRLSPVGKCAKGLNECGACMTGFNKVAVTTETNFKPCEKNIFDTPEKIDFYKKSSSSIAPVCSLAAVLVCVILILVIKHCKDRNSAKNIHEEPITPSAPSLYDMPQYVKKQDELMNVAQYVKKQDELLNVAQCVEKQEVIDMAHYIKKREETEFFPVTCIEEKKQLAKVFKQPNALYYFYTEEQFHEMGNESSINNDETRLSSWASATSALPEQIDSAAILIHQYSDINDSSRNLSVQQSSEIRSSGIVLDVLNGTQGNENSVQEAADNLCGVQSRDQGKP